MPDYNNTLNLPKTDFPMRGNLPKREPDILEKWEKNRLYYKIVEKNKGKTPYILHDGPPYANGEIHIGTALNKVLKDFIVKQKMKIIKFVTRCRKNELIWTNNYLAIIFEVSAQTNVFWALVSTLTRFSIKNWY